MDYASKLALLEHLIGLVDLYSASEPSPSIDRKQLHREICDTYGQVADIYESLAGKKKIEVKMLGGPAATFPNYFEAGFLSGRTFHTSQGRNELLTVIGRLKADSSQKPVHRGDPSGRGHSVFLVHGHNEAVLQTCARLVEKLELTVTILREQPNKGRTIIQKFRDHADVGFAVVLLTADDRGGQISKPVEEQCFRARQNVLLELGFFIGALGPERVCALYEEGVEIPSDYQGVAFVALDKNQLWRYELAKEMKAAGLPVDMNKLY
jgi:predicted nucleotide-binding protein